MFEDFSDMHNATDRERLLHLVLSWTIGREIAYTKPEFDGVHICGYREPEIGDLVIGRTKYVVGHLVKFDKSDKSRFDDVYYIHLLGTDIVQTWSNESFWSVIGIRDYRLWCGEKRTFFLLVQDAFNKGDEYTYRFNDVQIYGDTATITSRIRWSDKLQTTTIHNWQSYTKHKTGASILKAMKAQGYGSDESYKEAGE